MNLQDHNRSEHEASCPCKLCIGYDIQVAIQEKALDPKQWKPNSLETLLAGWRSSDLNWGLPSGHCLMCGGTLMWAYLTMEHFHIKRHNEKLQGTTWLSSFLLHKLGSSIANYKLYVKGSMSKAQLSTWACHNMELLPEKCVGIAARDIGDWVELRLAFTEIVEETRDQRIERYWRNDPRRSERENTSVGANT